MGLRLNRALGNQEEENDHERHRYTQVTKVFVKHANSNLRQIDRNEKYRTKIARTVKKQVVEFNINGLYKEI